MAQFKFDLEGVLRQRNNAEHIAQREVALAMQTFTQLQDQLRRLDQSVRGVTDDVRANHLIGPLDVSFMVAHRRYLRGMERAVIDLARQIADAKSKVDKAHAGLVEAARQRKTIEKLRDRELDRWKTGQALRESADNDEAGMQIAFGNIVEHRAG
ncbi:MAG: flagellar export protein FliJ [Burkholderiales bacterium]|nr:flagellar export protein FliJ [Phycisphaerae bacterium]